MDDGAPKPIPNGDRELARILRELDARDISDEPGIVDTDCLQPIRLNTRPGRGLRWAKRRRDDE